MDVPTVDPRFDALLGTRPDKPRETGRTMVIGDGLYDVAGMNHLTDLMAFAGEWIDAYKFQRGALGLQSPELVADKLALFDDHDVLAFPGGNFLEAAIHRDTAEEFLTAVADVGCPGVEVSSTSIALPLAEKAALVERAAEMGFHVHAEVGKKTSETGDESLSAAEVREEVAAMLDAGADAVILEMEQLERMRAADEGWTVDSLVDSYGRDHLLFEVPLASYYEVMATSWRYIRCVGPDVNLGNVAPAHVMPLEQQRRGLGQYAFSERFG